MVALLLKSNSPRAITLSTLTKAVARSVIFFRECGNFRLVLLPWKFHKYYKVSGMIFFTHLVT